MKYQIVVNQAGIVASGLHQKTDLIDWAILSHIYAWQASSKATRKDDKVWISYKNIMNELPLLGLNTKGAVSRRVYTMKELGLIEVDQVEDGRLFIKTTDLYESIQEYKTRSPRATAGVHDGEQGVFTKMNEGVHQNERGVHDGEQGPVHRGEPISNNNSHPTTKSGRASAHALPTGLNLDAWKRWIEFRRKERFKAYKTNETAEMLARWPHEIQAQAIQLSMDKHWQGLFPEKIGGEQHGSKQQHRKGTALEQVDQAFAGLESGESSLEGRRADVR